MTDRRKISATLEDYLEAILKLDNEKGAARVRDIAGELSVHKSSVSSALHNLADKKLVNYSPYELATLTPAGRKIAEEVSRNHGVIRRFLSDVLLVDDDVAERNACRIEHVVDRGVMERLALFAKFVNNCPRAGDDWIAGFERYVENMGEPAGTGDDVEEFINKFRKKARSSLREKE